MFNEFKFKAALVSYKRDFVQKLWPDEKFKWQAVKRFQDNWDVNAANFAEMLKKSLSATSNLLANVNNFPAKMIEKFAGNAPEEVRGMFIELFDESKDVYERINSFKMTLSKLLALYGDGDAHHYQNENSISTYLWLRYPNKYYIFKLSEVKAVASELESSYRFKKGAYAENIRNFYAFYNEICAELQRDEELRYMLAAQVDETCFNDLEMRTLTIDFGFYISRYYNKRDDKSTEDGWWPTDYSPGISVEEWIALIDDSEVFTPSSLEIMKRMLDYGGQASCKQLSGKYGETNNFYNSGSVALARRVAKKTGCPVMQRDAGNSRWWPILYVGKDAGNEEEGSFIWKLRDELASALHQVDLTKVPLYTRSGNEERADCRYWWLTANPKIWSFSDLAVGDVVSYSLYNDSGHKRRIFQNFLDAKAGDMIIGYESTPVMKIVALGKCTAEQDGEEIYFEKTEGLAAPIDYQTLHDCPELEQMEFFHNPQGSLFKLTKGEYDFIMDIIRDDNPIQAENAIEAYTKEDFLSEVYMTEAGYTRMQSVLKNKKNIILQGAPGVGKTFAAKRLAWSMMGEKDESRVEFVQFHQNYSYEDFVMGYKPVQDGFELRYGIFYQFCQRASNLPDKDFFFIIDEVNRGNMSKIFGELLMLIERDYRGTKATLAYNGLPFSVPKNLYLIGMMNTADRSLAMIDYALRRRFSFFEMEPGFDSDGFSRYQASLDNETLNELIDRVKDLNKEISADKSLGKGFCIGHSYFCGQDTCTDEWLDSVVNYDILPMLSEYWFDDPARLQRWENILRGVLQ